MSEPLDRRTLVTGSLAAGLAALASPAVAAEPPGARVKLIEAKIDDLESLFIARFKHKPNYNEYSNVALAVNAWLMANEYTAYSGFWTGETGKIGSDRTWQLCIIRRDA